MAEPYFPVHPGWWPDIAAHLTKPWPPAAVYSDLRWWADQEWCGRRGLGGRLVRRPGRHALQKRWGWEEWEVRTVLKDEATWGDRMTSGLQDAAIRPPVVHQKSGRRARISLQPHTNQLQGISSGHPATLSVGLADPVRLSEVWEEERQASPAGLRSRSLGLSARWSVALLALGPQRAEMAVRTVAEFCRGTEQPLDWGRFFSARRDGSTWRAALAWKEANSDG